MKTRVPDDLPAYDSPLLDSPGFRQWACGETTDDARTWQLQYDTQPELARRMDHAKATLLALQTPRYRLSAAERQQLTHGLRLRIRSGAHPVAARLMQPQQQWRGVWQAAAAIALLVSIGYWWQSSRPIVVETGYAEMRTVCLPDDSEVQLNANSRIEYHRNWDDTQERSVALTGQAYFHVQPKTGDHGQRVKFAVAAGTIRIEVLGTQFSVLSAARQTRVVLREGRVRVHPAAAPEAAVQLLPGQAIEYGSASATGSAVSQHVNIDHELSWLQGRWVLQNEPLPMLANRIEQQFGVRLTWQDPSMDTVRLSGSLPTKDIQVLREGLSIALDRDIQLSGQTLVIQPFSSLRR